jgi:glycosyltransferase involved in cell wall biosynthesis
MRFSVIIPAFNSATSIRACLDSVLAQEYKDFEALVMDGNSGDGTQAIVHEIAEKNTSVKLFSEKDKGIYDAVNKGIHRAKGEWIFILGSDDRLAEKNTLLKVNDAIGEINSGVVYGNVMIKGDAGWAKDGEIYGGEFSLEMLQQKNICQQAVFYHRSVFEQLGYFNIDYTVCADWDFMLHCAGKSKLKYIPLTIAEFYGGGTSKTVNEQKFYEDLPANLYRYFGWKIFRNEFRPSGFRFRKYANQLAVEGKKIKSFFYKRVASKHERK